MIIDQECVRQASLDQIKTMLTTPSRVGPLDGSITERRQQQRAEAEQ
jgi:hypothetical protein